MTSNEILDQKIRQGIKWRFPDGMPDGYQARLDYELEIIKKMGYTDYHLVVWEFLDYGRLLGYVPKERIAEAPADTAMLKEWIRQNGWKNQGFRIGPGRGSAVGSLVCYLLGITAIDPIKYGLLFERFLNPERVSMPDIDSDISASTRQKVIEHVQYLYGKDAVCGIMTTNAQAPKGSIRIAAKFYGLKKDGTPMTNLGIQISKDVPKDVGVSFATKVDANGAVDKESQTTLADYLTGKYADNPDAIEIIRWAKIVEGSFTAYGQHAAGIVISDNEDVSEYIPLRYNPGSGMMTTQCDMAQTEDNGLLKFDLLGLKTLDIITETLFMIEQNHGKIIDPLTLDVNDAKVYRQIFSAGKTNSVFQFESDGMKSMLKRFKPECFEDLIILVSMFRPGPLQYLDGVIDVKNKTAPMTFICPQMEAITSNTYGAIVYQEQVMAICQSLAGFTLGHADNVRRFMSKKKADKLAHEREAFIEGCGKNGISSEIADELFNQMMDFASYAFNKSHAAAYAYNAYITAWLKCYYPAEFLAAALNWADNNDISGLMYEAKALGVKVQAPDINVSQKEFCVMNGDIYFGLSAVAGVKDQADEIIKERRNGTFRSLKDFCMRVNPNSQVIDHLISAGAFDEFSDNRSAMKKMAEELKKLLPPILQKQSFIRSAELVLPYVEKLSGDQLTALQKENGLKAEIKEPTTADKLQKRIENASRALTDARQDYDSVRESVFSENKTERMAKEKEFLGMYVTQHPMDFYPKAEEVKSTTIDKIDGASQVAYGIVSDLNIKLRKKDGAKMAFFNLEDTTGKIEVCCFTKAYEKLADLLTDGAVLKLFGNTDIEEDMDEDGNIITHIKFMASSAVKVEERQIPLLMTVPDYDEFVAEIEKTFRETYEDSKGRSLVIYDKGKNLFYECTYKVKESLLQNAAVSEFYK